MQRTFCAMLVILFSCSSYAKKNISLYQIDLIVFTHSLSVSKEQFLISSIPPYKKALALNTSSSKNKIPYHLLPPSMSHLQPEYWALRRNGEYKLLLNYSWLQPQRSVQPIVLPKIYRDGWQVEGMILVQQGNYYLFDAQLLFSDSNNTEHSFAFKQKQRLKTGSIYYFDHPRAGILVKIHPAV